jgi:hypothetical protein
MADAKLIKRCVSSITFELKKQKMIFLVSNNKKISFGNFKNLKHGRKQ